MAHRDDEQSSASRSHDDDGNTPSAASSGRRRGAPHLVTKNAVAFMTLMGDLLRLHESSLALAYLYMHKYRKYIRDSKERGGEAVPDFLDPHTLALTCLSLCTKATESPRRLRSLITPAYSILHPQSPPISVPSHHYDTLRATIVTAELQLLRILKFELRLPLPHDYIPRMLDAAISIVPGEDFGRVNSEKQAEDKIAEITDTSLGRQSISLATRCMASYSIATFYDAKTIAVGVIHILLDANGMRPGEGSNKWLDMVAGRDVDVEDFKDVVKEVLIVFEGENSFKVQEIPVENEP